MKQNNLAARLQYVRLYVSGGHGLNITKSVGEGENGIQWKFTSKLDGLDFADDIALLSSTKHHIQEKTSHSGENITFRRKQQD